MSKSLIIKSNMTTILAIVILIVLIAVLIFLIKYDRNQVLKNKHISWLSHHVFREKEGDNSTAVQFHQVVLGFIFIFCVGMAGLFIIGLFEMFF